MNHERTCIGCRKKALKETMHRICKDSSGAVVFDRSGRGCGRGAYLCSEDCLNAAHIRQRLSAALKCKVDQRAYDHIIEDMRRAVHTDIQGCEGC